MSNETSSLINVEKETKENIKNIEEENKIQNRNTVEEGTKKEGVEIKEEEEEKGQYEQVVIIQGKQNENENENGKENEKELKKRKRNLIIKIILIVIGCISFVLGTIGIVLPILPTVPFYLLTLICFAKSSDRLHQWFVSSKFYKNNVEDFMEGRGMTVKAKIKTIICITILMGIGFIMMKKTLVGRIILGVVWVFHLILFIFIVKTNKEGGKNKTEDDKESTEKIEHPDIIDNNNNNLQNINTEQVVNKNTEDSENKYMNVQVCIDNKENNNIINNNNNNNNENIVHQY